MSHKPIRWGFQKSDDLLQYNTGRQTSIKLNETKIIQKGEGVVLLDHITTLRKTGYIAHQFHPA